ncbi:MAG: DUF1553 domain-containing protein [Planctomycetaceae bacterium]|nr:DUF1553 domain-containing protein [Planctomycetaceae bacterium]
MVVPAAEPVDFQTQIAPLLTEKCLACHNPAQKKGGLDLTTRAGLITGGESGLTVTSGDPGLSLIVDYVSGDKPRMPKTGEKLTPEEVSLLTAWIEQELPWPAKVELNPEAATWWSLRDLNAPPIPHIENSAKTHVRNPIDAFILARLREKGLHPSPAADRRTLIRRLKYDLIGLPPTPEEVERFVHDPDPQAYQKLIERYLDSPQYGERWARHWLDVVHYGDTHGYDKDKLRPNAWPYRDYVIRAFNTDKPYGRFVKEQIAGDVMPNAGGEGIVATGFLASGPWDFISHVEVPESKLDGQIARNLDRDDMVRTVMETFNSVTIGCARCHDHKFDPFLMEDYYSLQAVFSAIDRADRWYYDDPQLIQQRRQLLARQDTLQTAQQQLADIIQKNKGQELAAVEKQLKSLSDQASAGATQPEYGYHSQIVNRSDVTKWVQVDLGEPTVIDRVILAACFDNYANIGAGFGFPVRFKLEGSLSGDFATDAISIADRTNADVPNPGTTPMVFPANQPTVRYVRLTATKLTERKNDYILAIAELEVHDTSGSNVALGQPVTALDSIEAPVRWRKTNLVDGLYVGKKQSKTAEEQHQNLTARKQQLIRAALSEDQWARRTAVLSELEQVNERLAEMPKPQLVYAAATHFKPQGNFKPTDGTPREIRLLNRGNIKTPGEVMSPGAIAAFDHAKSLFDAGDELSEGERRLRLAEWIAHRDHPLTWRSIVNRVWGYHFGRGIVDSPNDFGRMGQSPSHPELLDWLATRFRDNGQSIKDLHRLICNSATYRQSSADISANREIDADNVYYWKFSRQRLEAEAIRDAVLAVSGKLNSEMYGPGFQDFVIEKPQHSPHYQYHLHDPLDPASHRRSVYRFAVRSQQQPFMTTLDCADPSMQVPKRNQTITPLQALSLLNNKFMVAMSEQFAQRLEADVESLDAQVRRGFALALSRPPTDDELTALVSYAEQNGLTNTCRLILNLNEFVFVD